jgi:hypothetical protein
VAHYPYVVINSVLPTTRINSVPILVPSCEVGEGDVLSVMDKLQGRFSYFRCLNSSTGVCQNTDVASVFPMPECMLLYVKCC